MSNVNSAPRLRIGEPRTTSASFTWTIDDFTNLEEKNGDFILSPPFYAEDNTTLFELILYPKGDVPIASDCVTLQLLSTEQISMKYNFEILNSKRKYSLSDSVSILRDCQVVGFERFIERHFLFDESNGFLLDNALTIHCDILIYISDNVLEVIKPMEIPEFCLCSDFAMLFERQEFTDIVLNVEGQKFPAHKAVLAARSSVFAAVFRTWNNSRETCELPITAIEPDIFHDLLRFLYTGENMADPGKAARLFVAANKYNVKRLEAMCEKAMTSGLTSVNATDILVFADSHNALQLREQAVDFIVLHITVVQKTDGWKSMASNHIKLINEIFEIFCNKP